MTENPTIGTTDIEAVTTPVAIDVPKLVATRLLIQSNSGGGKSWAVRRLLEQTHGRAQHLVLDSEGEFFTLRERFDYILAGRDGDCPVHPRSASMLARKLLDLGVSAILDLSDLPFNEKAAFVARFCEGLLTVRTAEHPTLVVVDEAHRFCPEGGHADSESSDAVAELASAGRKRAIAVVLATQRLSKLSKNAAAECVNRMIGRTGLDLDARRAADDLGFTSKAERHALGLLQPGMFHVFGPAFGIDGVRLVSIGEVETTHPTPGAKTPPVPAPRGTVTAALARLADLPKEAEEEARTMAEARAQLTALRRELAAAKKETPTAKLSKEDLRRFEKQAKSAADCSFATRSSLLVRELREALANVQKTFEVEVEGRFSEIVEKLLALTPPDPKDHRLAPLIAASLRAGACVVDDDSIFASKAGAATFNNENFGDRVAASHGANGSILVGPEERVLVACGACLATGLAQPWPRVRPATRVRRDVVPPDVRRTRRCGRSSCSTPLRRRVASADRSRNRPSRARVLRASDRGPDA